MKVLHLYKTYLPDTVGGVEHTINQIARSSSQFGIETEVLALSPGKVDRYFRVDNHCVYSCRSNFEIASTPFSASAILRFWHLTQRADIIHYHFPYPFADLLHFLTRVSKPTVVTYHSDIVKQKYLLSLYKPLMNFFLGSVGRIVATSPNYAESSEVLNKFSYKVSMIPIGLCKSTYPDINKGRLEYWRGIFRDRFFLFVGVLRYYKGLHVLIESAIKTSYPIVIIGSGPLEEKLKDQVKRLDIKNIHFLGFVDDEDKVALLTLSYAVVFPSHIRAEAYGISLLEGAMYGKPLISSEIGTGTSYINIDHETGLVVPSDNPPALRKAMEYLWYNPMISKKMGVCAQSRYYELFTADKMARSYYNLYTELLEK